MRAVLLVVLSATTVEVGVPYEQAPAAPTAVLGDVTAYGADPRDGNDDTAALQAALANCSKTGGQVFLPRGNYTVSRPVPAGWHPRMDDELNAQSIPILPVPSHCLVFGVGAGPGDSVVKFADSVNRAAFFRMFGTCSAHADGCGHCAPNSSAPGVPPVDCNGQMGPTGPPGHNWNNCNFSCPATESVQNVTLQDLFLWGSTTFTAYKGQTAGFREHGAGIYFYQGDAMQPPIRDIVVRRITAGGFAGDALDFGGGVQNLLVEDVGLKDYLRQGLDFAGQPKNSVGDAPSKNFTARRVRDLAFTPGVTAGGSTIHVEEAGGLKDVYIYDCVCNHSILASGPTHMVIRDNVVEGQILGNLDRDLTIANNRVFSRPPPTGCNRPAPGQLGESTGQSTALIAASFGTGLAVFNNTLTHHSDCDPRWSEQIGIQLLGGVESYPIESNVLVHGNVFEFEGLQANSTLIDLSGCKDVIVRDNNYGPSGGTDVDHTTASRCTNCSFGRPPVTSSQPCVSVTQFGATGDDHSDDTEAIQAALNFCVENGGGVCVPAGTFMISLPPKSNQTDLCLAIPSDCTLSGVGEDSILKYSDDVNVQGWWRMLGPALQADDLSARLATDEKAGSAHNITIRDLHLDGSTNHTSYPCSIPGPNGKPYYVCEHNALLFFYTPLPGVIRDVTVQRMVVEAIAGDCMDFGDGVQNLLVEDVQLRDYLRQGVDLAGNVNARNHTVRRVKELPWRTVVNPGGSTLHVEEAQGLCDVVLEDSVCNHSILASSAHNLTIRNNVVHGMIEANTDSLLYVTNNTIYPHGNGSMMQMLSPQHAVISANTLHGDPALQLTGIYVWGKDEGYPAATNITISNNAFNGPFTAQGKALHLYGVDRVVVRGNSFEETPNGATQGNNSCVCCRQPAKIAALCVDVELEA